MEQKNVWTLVLEKTDIVSVISEFVQMQKRGKNYLGLCPFHGEKTPSFTVSPEKNIFSCFGCKKSGSVIKFIELYKKITPIEALKYLAEKVGVDASNYLQRYDKGSKLTEDQLQIIDIENDAHTFFQYHMISAKINNDELKKFLEKRKLTHELIKEFELGFAPKDESIYNFLKQKSYTDLDILKSSLTSSKDITGNFFVDRLMFPIKDKDGHVVAFSGRDISGKSTSKYLNSSETSVFKKGSVLFNYFKAKPFINDSKEVYLVEGQFDCIALHKVGIKNVVAIMGTAFTEEHLELFKNCQINLFFDSDEAGKIATKKNLKMILFFAGKFNLKVNLIVNNLTKDADEIFNIDEGKTLTKILGAKIDASEYLFKEYIIGSENLLAKQRTKNYQEMFEYLYYLTNQERALFKDRVLKQNYLSEETYRSFESEFLVPNFPSDPSFKQIINRFNKKEGADFPKTPSFMNNFDFDDSIFSPPPIEKGFTGFVSIEDLDFKKKDSKFSNKNIRQFGRNKIISQLILTFLREPLLAEKYKDMLSQVKLRDFEERRRELLMFVIDNNFKLNNKDELKHKIEEAKITKATKENYLKALEEISFNIETINEAKIQDHLRSLNAENEVVENQKEHLTAEKILGTKK
ncbi:DNA primase [Metamycoplasma subdolum]|uniref:DNA primase n=1 Tax=Metamycoplasma subdolum TaxID=92407 RepID=A0A3M0AHD7_9BACT|nr:DNA primase [Metamycoplasma subdolum]RMA78642.1 DNA primase [Metamycoplasma subdolum]WPB50756.1 DNA primase [Metamycoplasma subdolum]